MAGASGRTKVALSWGMLDQIVNSGSNFLFVVIAAKALAPSEFGAIAFAFELYVLSVLAARGFASDCLTSRFAGLPAETVRTATKSAGTTSLVAAAAVAVGTVLTALFVDAPLSGVLLVAAVLLPGLALQDFVRNALMVAGRVRDTFLNDVLWAVIQLPALGLAIWIHPSPETVFGAWAATGGLAALVGLFQLRSGLASPKAVKPWLQQNRDLWPYFVGDNMVFEITSLLVVVVISSTSGLVGLAGFRVAMTLCAPLTTVGRGITAVAVVILARRRTEPAWVRSSALRISGVLAPIAIAWGALMTFLPDVVGQALFGQSWQHGTSLVFWAGFMCAATLFGAGAIAGMRALSAGREVVTARLTASVTAGAFAIVGGLLDGVHGMFVAVAISFPLQCVIWWVALRTSARRAPNDDSADETTADPAAQPDLP